MQLINLMVNYFYRKYGLSVHIYLFIYRRLFRNFQENLSDLRILRILLYVH